MRLWPIRPATLAGALVVLILVAGGIQGTLAAFTDPAAVRAGTAGSHGTAFASGAIATPVVPTAATSSSSVRVDWSVTAAGIGTASRYEVVRYPSAAGGSGTVVCATSAPTVTCLDGDPADGAAWYAVRARVGENWTKEGGRVAYNPDTTGPTVVITAPLNGCSGSVACGTTSDPSGVAKVEYRLRWTQTGAITGYVYGYDCWSGSTWQSSADGTCTFNNATLVGSSWTVPGSKTTAYAGSGFLIRDVYLLTVRSTDTRGNVTERQLSLG